MRSPAVLCCLLLIPSRVPAYSVLTHEAIIDSAWDGSLKPQLTRRFPNASPDNLRTAHGFAYGGAIIQDMGYYPRGSHEFSDLAHYIRSGNFVLNLIRESSTLDEYAFALGALSHYAADDQGHKLAVNVAEPLLYKKIARKFGPVVTYEDNPTDHLRTEFSFDVLQVARGYYAPEAYHDFIGFHVAAPLLDRAFNDTYCLHLADLFKDPARSINSYRHAVSGFIPKATRVAWVMKRKDIEQHSSGIVRSQFTYNISRSSFEKEWGSNYEHPTLGDRILAFFLKLLPRVGPLKDLSFKTPDAKSENLFIKSFDATLDEYRTLLTAAGDGQLRLPDINFDTGQPARPGTYRLADDAQAKWNIRLKSRAVSCPIPATGKS